VTASLGDALHSITSRITSSAMDFGDYEPNAWVYGIAVGWDCEEDHDHDDICGGTAAMAELRARFGWDEAAVARLRALRKAYAAATSETDAQALDHAERERRQDVYERYAYPPGPGVRL
jgi:hypothetical protein